MVDRAVGQAAAHRKAGVTGPDDYGRRTHGIRHGESQFKRFS